ncbi:conserved hypothetical protein [Leishmania major strain Friedlin]|uniref:GST N-terminal domain-containing protein n=1 Tax=Leishmania major TaxID=5664 RepID=Q4Q940_LEIMA|nr:conserved hypothetical protein [Leishmania major strain Friedlin]CAG9576475.1 Glutaredoxin/Glutathione_S-transferase_-_N-terminal_domain_containing_protein_-_putative [Leishmania major strain Friedlin]CAJ05310.1 conserved hypothetical protein [Leishmania major strain Friedlin]|eukprot:XP_001684158.1 conserved hypothetical protein [Leishmania major strain Friedlin]
MRFLAKAATTSAVTLGVGAVALLYCQRARNPGAAAGTSEVTKQLSAKEFNGLQNATLLKEALAPSHLPWTFHAQKDRYTNLRELTTHASQETATAQPPGGRAYTASSSDMKLTFYRLLGCPYCAKVEAVLQYHDVPYEEVHVDPLSGKGLPDRRYQLAPQLYLAPLAKRNSGGAEAAATDSNGVYVVDSAEIVSRLSGPLKYAADIANPRISATRDWITNHFHGASFAITNNSFCDAYATYAYVTPSNYQNFLYHVVGSAALSVLSRYKIQPRLIAKMECADGPAAATPTGAPASTDSNGLWMLSEASRKALAATVRFGAVEEWLRAELQTFLQRRPADKVFHGGSSPDLADVEMYGVTRVVDQHPRLGAVVREGAFGEWQTAMREKLKANTGSVYA